MATSVFNEDLGKEELLFAGVVTGTLERYKDLLNSLGDVDVRGLRQRTLLFVAVCLGKLDWVEGLLEKGANPGLRDGEGVSIVELAQGLAEKYPEQEARQLISKLVRLVMIGRESVTQGGYNTASTCQDTRRAVLGQDMISDLSRKMASMCESISDIQIRIVNIDTRSQETTANLDLINDVKTEMVTVHKSIDDVKTEIATRDVLLSALESSITSLANRERPGVGTPETSTVPEEVVLSAPLTEEEKGKECVEAMMRRTRILTSDDGKVTKARGWYERLYSKGDETACLIKFLESQDDVSIEIDFDSEYIGKMKSTFRDHDGVERDGSGYFYFADFEEKKVYLGGGDGYEQETIGGLAGALAQMSVCLAFNNGGRPYAKGDDVTERRMENALKEAKEEYRKNREGVDMFIKEAVRKETQHGKEVYLTSAVPSIISESGSTEGTSRLQRQVPLLLELFRDSVMPALLTKAQV